MKGTKGTGEVIQFKNKGRAQAPFWEEYRKQRIGNVTVHASTEFYPLHRGTDYRIVLGYGQDGLLLLS